MSAGETEGLDFEFEHEQVELLADPATGLRGVIAIHSRILGPAMGGCRLSAYPGITAATLDALRLSKAMTLKNSAAGLDLGGGKAVLLDDGGWDEPASRTARMAALGACIDKLGGDYITAEDVGTTPTDMESIGRATPWVAGRPPASGGRGDPSAATARTVFGAILSGVEVGLGAANLNGVSVGLIGAGHVGSHLARMLAVAGADLVIADLRPERARALAAEVGGWVDDPAALALADVDVLAPCALGGAIEPAHVSRLRTRVIAGAANNQLSDTSLAASLHAEGILFVPDFIANCGGIIHVGAEVLGFDDLEVERRIAEATRRTRSMLELARAEDRVPWELALALAAQRIEDARANRVAPEPGSAR